MGATPMPGRRGEDERMRVPKSDEIAASPGRREAGMWGYLVHPSLLPTIFAPSGSGPQSPAGEDTTARKV